MWCHISGDRVLLPEGGGGVNCQYSWSLDFKCGLTCLVIPKLLMWENHGRAVKAATVVSVMDDLWEVWLSRHYREPPWALVIDAVSFAILFTFSPLHCASPSGQKHTARGRLFSEHGRAHASPQPHCTAVNTGQNILSVRVLFPHNHWSCITTVKSNPACERRVYGTSDLQVFV